MAVPRAYIQGPMVVLEDYAQASEAVLRAYVQVPLVVYRILYSGI